MRKLIFCAFLFIVLFGAVAGSLYVRDELRTPYPQPANPVVVNIPAHFRARDVVGLLENKNVIHNQYVTLGYIFYSGLRKKLQAGEYLFDQPMTPSEVI